MLPGTMANACVCEECSAAPLAGMIERAASNSEDVGNMCCCNVELELLCESALGLKGCMVSGALTVSGAVPVCVLSGTITNECSCEECSAAPLCGTAPELTSSCKNKSRLSQATAFSLNLRVYSLRV